MKCADCIEEKKFPSEAAEATHILVLDSPDDKILPLCDRHLHQYTELEGELNLDFYMVKLDGIGAYAFVDRVNEVLAFHEKKYVYLLNEYDKLKKMLP